MINQTEAGLDERELLYKWLVMKTVKFRTLINCLTNKLLLIRLSSSLSEDCTSSRAKQEDLLLTKPECGDNGKGPFSRCDL